MGCSAHFRGLVAKLTAVIKDKWPESLDGNAFVWAEAERLEEYRKLQVLFKEADELWKNGQEAEFKKIVTEWGRLSLELHRMYAMDLRQREAA